MNDDRIISPDHPALAGHFPGQPLVPGVVMLSHVCDAVHRDFPAITIAGIKRLKFLQPLLPAQPFRIVLDLAATAPVSQLKFQCWSAATLLAEGQLLLQSR